MIALDAFRWTDPQTWPWIIWLWLAIGIANFGWSGLKWLRKRQAESWPTISGRIETATAQEAEVGFWNSKRRGTWEAIIGYSYPVDGSTHSGIYKETSLSDIEAVEFVRDMALRSVSVHVDPSNASASVLAKADVEELLKTKRPQSEEERLAAEEATALPLWAQPLLWPLALCAALGLAASCCAHIGSLFGRQVLPGYCFVLLHVGAIALGFACAFVMQKSVGNLNRSDSWKLAMKGAPVWVRYFCYALFAYAIVNFMIGMAEASGQKHHGTNAMDWRTFSGHWMLFYGGEFGTLYSALRSVRRRCMNGHLLEAGSRYCVQCGCPEK